MIRAATLLLLLTMNAAPRAGDGLPVDPRLFDEAESQRVLLVTFPDRGKHRIAVGPRMNQYVARGYEDSTWSRRTARELGADYGLERLAAWPVTELDVHCVAYLVPAQRSLDDVVAALARDPRVTDAQPMMRYRTHAAAERDPYFKLQVNLHELGLRSLHGRATGSGVRVAIIDTGVDLEHPDLAGQFDAHENFVREVSPGFGNDRHGTAVAGIIAAKTGNGAGIAGIAPGARLLAYKACWPVADDALEARCNSFTLALALNAALRTGADVINLSLSGPHDPLIAALLAEAAARGIIAVAADHGNEPNGSQSFPATLESVIAVRARGRAAPAAVPANVVSMPGLEILSTVPAGTYDFLTGCSFSAAQVSGLAALARELRPSTTSAQIVEALRRRAAGGPAEFLALVPSY